MPDYSKGKIYKIYSKTLDNCYYGSTTMTLKKRLTAHKSKFKNGKYCKSRDVLKYNDYEIILVELFPCKNKKQLDRREGYYQRNFKCINTQIAGRTQKEWVQDHKEERKKYHKQYYQDHSKEKLKVKMTCECGSVVRKDNVRRHNKTKKHLKYIESQQPTVKVSNRV